MAVAEQMAFKLALTSQAASTMGFDPKWDAAVANFLRTFSLWQADEEYGAKAKVDEAWQASHILLESRFGKGWKHHPDAAAEIEQADAAYQAGEDAHHEAFVAPYWKALRDLAGTPAPSIAAATFKQLLIQSEEVWNDSAMEVDCMQIVVEDFTRLAA